VSAVVVDLADGANPAAVAEHIETWLYFEVFTTAEERELMIRGRLQKMTALLGMFRALLMFVSIVIIALIVYVLTMEKVKVIATLKLIGAPNFVIVRMIMEQSLFLTVAGFAFGYAVLVANLDRFPRTLLLLPSDTSTTFAIMLVGGVLASFVGIWRALQTHPSVALGG
jgi:putative ABC transport system permease protein